MNILDKYHFLREFPATYLYELLIMLKDISEDEKNEIIYQLKKEIEEREREKKREESENRKFKRGCLFFVIALICIGVIIFGAPHLFTKKQEQAVEPIVEMSRIDIMISELIKKYNADTTWIHFYDNLDFDKYIYTYKIKNELLNKEHIFIRSVVVDIDSVDGSVILYFKSVVDILKPSFLFVLKSKKQFVDSILKYPSSRYAFLNDGDYAIVAKISEVYKETVDSLNEASFIAKGKLIDFVYLGDITPKNK